MDADILDKEICYYIIEKYNNNNTNTILLNSSFNDIKCCGVSCHHIILDFFLFYIKIYTWEISTENKNILFFKIKNIKMRYLKY